MKTEKMPVSVFGKDLKVGDVIACWWGNGRDTILALRPYDGPLTCFTEGAQLADTAMLKTGFTVENGAVYEVFSR